MANNYKKNKKKKGNTGNSRYTGREYDSSKKRVSTEDKGYDDAADNRSTIPDNPRANDPGWYNASKQIVSDATKIPFAHQQGVAIPDLALSEGYKVPGLMVLDALPIPGIAESATDGVNIAATGVFQFIRKNLSTYATYAPADVMMYVLGIGSNIFPLYAHIKRAFGLINMYSSINLYWNEQVFKAIYHFDHTAYVEFSTNINKYRTMFNNLILKASSLYLPTDFSITARHAWMFSNIFIDGNSVKSQLYAYRPAGFYVLDETKYETGTALTLVPDSVGFGWSNASSMEQLLSLFDQMVEAYRNSDSMNKIAADMKRAFEGRSFYQLTWCAEDYMVIPTKSSEVLSTIENTIIMPQDETISAGNRVDWDIVQNVDHNIITFTPYLTNSAISDGELVDFWKHNKVLNMHWDNPSSDDVNVATRNMLTLVTDIAIPNARKSIRAAGSEIITACTMFGWNNHTTWEDEDDGYGRTQTIRYTYTDPTMSGGVTQAAMAQMWSVFDWAPQSYLMITLDEETPTYRLLCDFDNYTYIDDDTIGDIHRAVITNMWKIPQLGMMEG